MVSITSNDRRYGIELIECCEMLTPMMFTEQQHSITVGKEELLTGWRRGRRVMGPVQHRSTSLIAFGKIDATPHQNHIIALCVLGNTPYTHG
jgi:hypothetical protein